MALSRAVVRIPASTSNLGPGFDCLGLALQLYNTVRIERVEGGSNRGMIADTAAAFFQRVKERPIRAFEFAVKIEGAIPVSRGLGSSVTVRLGVLMGLAELVRDEVTVSQAEILQLLIELERHPDNAVASFLGGFAVCSRANGDRASGFGYTRVPVGPQLSFVALIPELRLTTEKARGILPNEIPLKLAVENSQRTARIAALFCLGEYAALRGLFIDHFHQPFRQSLIPGFAEILAAATDAGALGSFLSGAGSTLMAVTLERPEEISRAMLTAAEKYQLPGQVLLLKADNDGAQVLP